MATLLRTGGTTIGAFFINSINRGSFRAEQFTLLQGVADQIAVAVSNILANQEILEREREKSVLLSISEDIAGARNAVELMQVIRDKAQRLIPFHDTGIFIVEPGGEYHFDLAVNLPGWETSEGSQLLQSQGHRRIRHKDSYVECVMRDLQVAGNPVIEDFERRFEEFDYPFFPVLKRLGYQEFMVAELKTGSKTFGTLWLNALEKNHFSPKQFDIFQTLADQVAVAVANILANDEILEREREKSRLLEITELIAQIKANDDLLRLIVDKIKPLFGFEDCGLFVVSADKQTHSDLAAVIPGVSPSEFNERIAAVRADRDVPHSGSVVEQMMRKIEAAGKPVLLDFVDLVEQFPDYPQFVGTDILELGYRDCLAANLVVRGEAIGMFCVNARAKNFFQPQIFPLFQAVAHSISIAVANIQANEEILQREREKSLLLAISEVITTVRSKTDLLALIVEKIKPVFNFYDCGIFVFDREKRRLEDLTVSHPGISQPTAKNFLWQNVSANIEFENSIWEAVFATMRAARRPIIFDHQNIEIPDWGKYDQAAVIRDAGYAESLLTILTTGGEELGVFVVNSLEKGAFGERHFAVFQNIADQMAVAVSNILANEEIEKQLSEIKNLKKRLEAENVYLSEEIKRNYNFAEIIGTSEPLRRVFGVVEQVAPTDATVLIQGETGTGKELIARAVHQRSPRSGRPLIKINCAALPRELVESELFGHERGSFTGAFEKRLGKFELADQGTIFLDEIGELPLEMQVKLLRVLQEREIERLGGKGTIKLDLRVVAATNRNLAQEVQAGRFRADLYYRLCTVEIFMPPLRERQADIEPLTMYFAQKYAAKFSRKIERVSSQMLRDLLAYDFPGNVRELEHIVEHAVIFSRGEKLILPRPLAVNTDDQTSASSMVDAPPKFSPRENGRNGEPQTLETIERAHILAVLRQTSGKIKGKGGAAEILGLNPATVYFRMKKLGIEK